MKFLLLSALVLCVSALGEDHCTWGPSHWCSSLNNAKSCGAVQHCMDTTWRTDTSYKNDDTEVCEFCENILGDVRKFLTANETEADVRQYFDSACNLIPVEELAEKCKDTINENLNELFDMIKQELDPKAICAAIELCQGFQDTAVHADNPKFHRVALQKAPSVMAVNNAPQDPDTVCADCKKLMTDLAKELTENATAAQVEGMLKEELCSQLGALKDECDTLVETYTPEILEMLASQMDPDLTCAALGLCQGDVLLLVKMKLRKSPLYQALAKNTNANSEECTFCKIVFTELQELDRSTATQEEVEDFVKTNLCSKLGSYAEVCEDTVTNYGQMVFELLATELDPDTRCQGFGFCTAGKFVDETIRAAMPASNPVNQETRNVRSSAGCILCESVMMELRTLLEKNQTEEELVADLEKVCSIMPDSIKADCMDFVDTYGPAVVEMLLQELDPKVVCTALGLCPGSKRPAAVPKVAKPVNAGEMCGVCETIIQYLDSILQENATQEEIKKDLERICNFLPDTLKEQCDDLVEQYMSLIIQLVAQGLTPKEVCTEIGLCTAAQAAIRPFINQVPIMPMQPEKLIVPESAPLVGVNECTYGPAYWCANLENAKRCKAEAHCQEKVWNKN